MWVLVDYYYYYYYCFICCCLSLNNCRMLVVLSCCVKLRIVPSQFCYWLCVSALLCVHELRIIVVLWLGNITLAPCGLRGCKNRAHSVSWLEVVKGVLKIVLLPMAIFSVSLLCLWCVCCFVYSFWLSLSFGYQCNWLPGKTRLWNDLLCVKWDVKPYTLNHVLSCLSLCVEMFSITF